MNRIVFSLRYLLRDWRSGELRIIALALVIAVASLTTVGRSYRTGHGTTGD